MILSFALMGTAMRMLAIIPSSYDSIGIAAPILTTLARMVQGFSLGGEVGPTTAYLMEAAALAPAWYLLFATAVGLAAMVMMRETAPNRS